MQAGEPLNAFLSKFTKPEKGSLKKKLAAAFSAAKRKK